MKILPKKEREALENTFYDSVPFVPGWYVLHIIEEAGYLKSEFANVAGVTRITLYRMYDKKRLDQKDLRLLESTLTRQVFISALARVVLINYMASNKPVEQAKLLVHTALTTPGVTLADLWLHPRLKDEDVRLLELAISVAEVLSMSGAELLAWRQDRRISQESLAHQLGVSTHKISKIEQSTIVPIRIVEYLRFME